MTVRTDPSDEISPSEPVGEGSVIFILGMTGRTGDVFLCQNGGSTDMSKEVPCRYRTPSDGRTGVFGGAPSYCCGNSADDSTSTIEGSIAV